MIMQWAFALHITGGTVGLLAGIVAVLAAKGERVHRVAGTVFLVSMLAMATLADYLAAVRPGEMPELIVGTFAIYLVATGWLTVRRQEGATGWAEKIALAVVGCLGLPFAVMSFDVAMGHTLPFNSAPLNRPEAIFLYIFTLIIALAAIGDIRMLWGRGVAGARRIVRHLWRMCLGLALAAGSAFTNGLPRLLPHGVHLPLLLLFMPQFAVLALMVFWAVRVRFTGWYGHAAVSAA